MVYSGIHLQMVSNVPKHIPDVIHITDDAQMLDLSLHLYTGSSDGQL